MQALIWILRFAIVVILVWFAVKNAQEITIHGLPDQTLRAPLVFVLLVVFVAGTVIGLLAWLPTVFATPRDRRLKRALKRPCRSSLRAGARGSPRRSARPAAGHD